MDTPGVQVGVFFFPFKYLALVLLLLQTSAVVLAMRFSRTAGDDGKRYLTTTAVCMAEFCKIIGSAVLLFIERRDSMSFPQAVAFLFGETLSNMSETLKLAVPAFLYTIQNNLLFVALSNLDAATYQVTYQLKILTTAVFSVALLGKALDKMQWFALLLLFSGVALVQMPKDGDEEPKEGANPFVGLVAVLTACCSSGFAGVYFEKILKGSKQSVWLRNFQLGWFGFVLGFIAVFVNDYEQVTDGGFFQHYDNFTWIVISLYAFGGLIVAAVIKYADNILKTFANAMSIVLTGVVSLVLFPDFTLSLNFMGGAFLVIVATFFYSNPKILQKQPPVLP
eukprot:m.483482 g.483482  ORF g.483482 m.483482 type:complete len:337 (-) comp22954_c0_seq1:212-1222(-)